MTEDRPARHRHRKKKSLQRRIKTKMERYLGDDQILYVFLAVILAFVAGYFVLKFITGVGGD